MREVVDLYSAAYPHPRPAIEVLDLVGLGDRPDVRVSALSGGQRRRLDLALGIAGDPELVFLDEPTTGFDPSARRQSWELISALRDLGKTILLTTHYMDEAQHLADRVVVIARGKVIAEGTPDTLGAGVAEATLVCFRVPYGVDGDELPLPADAEVERRDRLVSFRTRTPTRDLAPLVAWAADAAIELEAPDRDPAQPRGRLPPAHRGARMTIPPVPISPCSAAGCAPGCASSCAPAAPSSSPSPSRSSCSCSSTGSTATRPSTPWAPPARSSSPSSTRRRSRIFSLTTACYTSVILGIATARDSGLLKRVRGTPLPMSIYLGAWLAGAALTGILAVVLLFVVAIPAFGVHDLPPHAARGDRDPRARRGVPVVASASRSRRWRRPPTRRCRSRS